MLRKRIEELLDNNEFNLAIKKNFLETLRVYKNYLDNNKEIYHSENSLKNLIGQKRKRKLRQSGKNDERNGEK